MKPREIEFLLQELCVDLGFCLPASAQEQIKQYSGTNIDVLTNANIRAEGLNPDVDTSLSLRREMRARVEKYFRISEDRGETLENSI